MDLKMKEYHFPVLVHTCKISLVPIQEHNLAREERYLKLQKMKEVKDFGTPVPLGQVFEITKRTEPDGPPTYLKLPKSCRCRKFTSLRDADQYVSTYTAKDLLANGNAMCTWKLLVKGLEPDDNQIWMPAQGRVPRIDLISRADIERAYIGSDRKSKHYKFNRITNRFDIVAEPPEGMSKQEWILEGEKEIQDERKLRKRFRDYINECHEVTMTARAAITVPWIIEKDAWKKGIKDRFTGDEFDGRTIMGFGPDMKSTHSYTHYLKVRAQEYEKIIQEENS